MGRRIISLCTGDKRYMSAFADYCARNEGSRISVKTFDTREALERHEKTGNSDLILMDSALMGREKLSYNTKLAILSEEKYVDKSEYIYVYKFQRMDAIIKQIYQIFADTGNGDEYSCVGRTGCEITGVFSPCYPAQREQYAREFAAVCGNKCSVLYINLAELTEHDTDEEEGVSELLYYLNDESKPASYRLLTMLKEERGYKSLAGVKHYRDLYEMSSEDADRLFRCIHSLDEFEKVIIDVGFLGSMVYDILERCDILHMPVMDERSMRLKHLMKDMASCGQEKLINDIKVIGLPGWWNERKDMRSKWVGYEK